MSRGVFGAAQSAAGALSTCAMGVTVVGVGLPVERRVVAVGSCRAHNVFVNSPFLALTAGLFDAAFLLPFFETSPDVKVS